MARCRAGIFRLAGAGGACQWFLAARCRHAPSRIAWCGTAAGWKRRCGRRARTRKPRCLRRCSKAASRDPGSALDRRVVSSTRQRKPERKNPRAIENLLETGDWSWLPVPPRKRCGPGDKDLVHELALEVWHSPRLYFTNFVGIPLAGPTDARHPIPYLGPG